MWAGRCPHPHHIPAQAESSGLTAGLSIPAWSHGTSGQPEIFIPLTSVVFSVYSITGSSTEHKGRIHQLILLLTSLRLPHTFVHQGQAAEFLQLMLSSIRTVPLPRPPLCPISSSLLAPQLVDRGLQAPAEPPQAPAGGEKPLGGGGAGAVGLKVHAWVRVGRKASSYCRLAE